MTLTCSDLGDGGIDPPAGRVACAKSGTWALNWTYSQLVSSQTVDRKPGGAEPHYSGAWHTAAVAEAARAFGVDPERGLSAAEARERLKTHGANPLTAARKESAVQAFLRQYRDFMQIVPPRPR